MPWESRKVGDKYCVFKKGSTESLYCHNTEAEASNHIKALYANVPESGSKTLIDQAKEWLSGLFSNTEPAPAVVSAAATGLKPIYVTKDLDGSLRATMIFSNNFVDRHDQTIPEVIHEEYLNWVDRTKLYPEFQIWHMGEKSRWGQGEVVTRIGNFTLVSGPVDPGKEALATALANDPNTGVSNGYYALYTPDRKDFVAWYPFEVSALPLKSSANVWMGDSQVLESEGFLLKAEHKALLISKGVDEKFLDAMEQDILARGVQVEQQGVASKEVEQPAAATTEVVSATPITAEILVSTITKIMEPINARFEALEEGQKSLTQQTQKSQDEIVSDAILARVGPSLGYKATEDPTNAPKVGDGTIQSEAELQKEFNWLDKQLDAVMKQNGVAV